MFEQTHEEFEEEIHEFTVINCGMDEFNGTYVIDTAKNGGLWKEKLCFRKNGSEHTIHYGGHWWVMCKNYDETFYSNASDAGLPPRTGWCRNFEVADEGSGSLPEVVPGRYKDYELKKPGDTADKELDAPTAMYRRKVPSDRIFMS